MVDYHIFFALLINRIGQINRINQIRRGRGTELNFFHEDPPFQKVHFIFPHLVLQLAFGIHDYGISGFDHLQLGSIL